MLPVELRYCKLTANASEPTRASEKAAGLDLYSAYDYDLGVKEIILVKTDLQVRTNMLLYLKNCSEFFIKDIIANWLLWACCPSHWISVEPIH